jgi:CheY-like chemotaxis protein
MIVLAVDDEKEYLLLLRTFLMDEGHIVMMAENGREALTKLALQKVDLIISDIYMPGMDGIAFYKKVRAMKGNEKVPFLFVSAYDDALTMGAVQNPAIEGFLKKGRPVELLKEWIHFLTAPADKKPEHPPSSH